MFGLLGKVSGLGAFALVSLAGSPLGATAQSGYEVEARVWFDAGDEPQFDRGDRARIYYETSQDAYVSVFHVDSDGAARLIFPSTPEQSNYVRGNREYRLLFPGSTYWPVDDAPGMGYFFIVASPDPMDFSGLDYSFRYREWDLSPVSNQIYRDPFVAMDDFVAYLLPQWEEAEYALDYATYHVGGRYEYPRFLCYECHGYRPYNAWNPYYDACTSFRVVVWDDPYYYPAQRYRGDRVVFVRRPNPRQPRYVFKERGDGEGSVPLVTTAPRPGVEGDIARRNVVQTGQGGVGRTVPVRLPTRGSTTAPRRSPVTGGSPNGGDRGTSGIRGPDRPTLQRRPSGSSVDQGTPRASDPDRSVRPTPRSGGSQPAVRRPSGDPVRPGARPTERAQPRRRGGGEDARPAPTDRGSATRPSRSTGGSSGGQARSPSSQSGSSSPSASTRSTPQAAPPRASTPRRSGGTQPAARSAPPTRSRPATGSAQPRSRPAPSAGSSSSKGSTGSARGSSRARPKRRGGGG